MKESVLLIHVRSKVVVTRVTHPFLVFECFASRVRRRSSVASVAQQKLNGFHALFERTGAERSRAQQHHKKLRGPSTSIGTVVPAERTPKQHPELQGHDVIQKHGAPHKAQNFGGLVIL